MMNKIKQWFKSKTIWFNSVIVPALMSLMLYAEQSLPLIRDNLGSSFGITTIIIGLINVWLRSVTTKPLSEK